jgi:DNA-binding NarL/FixJ family response regulator
MKRGYLLYGAVAGVLLIILEAIQYKAIVRDLEIELFGAVIALIFMGIGVYIGVLFVKRKQSHHLNKNVALKYQLSERELEVLQLLAEGLSNQEIADRLFVSLNTTKTHLSNLYGKLHVKRRTQAVQKARELSILTSPESTK